MGLGRLLLRSVTGGLFIGHGKQKRFGWFGGAGLEATAQGFEARGLRPGRRNALGAGPAESGGGALLARGLARPLAEAALISVMLTAIRTVHWQNGPWATKGGYEYNLTLIAALLALAETGPGAASLDHALGLRLSGASLNRVRRPGAAVAASRLARLPEGEPPVIYLGAWTQPIP